MARLKKSAIDAATQMLDERTEQAGMGIGDGEIPIEHDGCVSH
jgi:hypothetical protein